MKNNNTPGLGSYLILFLLLLINSSAIAQDLDKVYERYRAEIEKIQGEEASRNFIFTHAKSEFGLTENIMSFLVDLNGGAFTKQIDFLMNVPVQKWNPNIGYGGSGAYELRNVQRLVNKNVTTAFHNVATYADKISKGLKYYSLCSSIIEAINGDDRAKLKSLHTTFEIVMGWMTSDFPNMNVAMLSVGFINYALDKFISTTLDEYNEYWWNKYSEYLSTRYPGFLQNWARQCRATWEHFLRAGYQNFGIQPNSLNKELRLCTEVLSMPKIYSGLHLQPVITKNICIRICWHGRNGMQSWRRLLHGENQSATPESLMN